MTDRAYVYGAHNGQGYTAIEGEGADGKYRTHFDPRVEVSAPGHGLVQIGVVPPTAEVDDESERWLPDNGQYLSLDWAGCNRLIRAVREARDATFGRAE